MAGLCLFYVKLLQDTHFITKLILDQQALAVFFGICLNCKILLP